MPERNQLRGLKKSLDMIQRSPLGEMNDAVRIMIGTEKVIADLSRLLSNVSGLVEDGFSCWIDFDLMNDRYVGHIYPSD